MTNSFLAPSVRSGAQPGRLVLLSMFLLAGCAAAVDGTEAQTGRLGSALIACDETTGCPSEDTRIDSDLVGLPDLHPSPFTRGPARHAISVLNFAPAPAAASITFVDFGPSCQQHLATAPIAADSSTVVLLSLPESCYGRGSFTLKADETNVIVESDETNNIYVRGGGGCGGSGGGGGSGGLVRKR